MKEFTIRAATKSDIPEILGLLYELGRPQPKNDSDVKDFKKIAKNYISDSDKTIIVAISDGVVVGLVSIVFLPRLNQTDLEMYIPELIVLEKYQRKGIGKKLIKKCIDLGKERKCHRIRLESGNHRVESHQFYLDLGFEQSSLSFSMSLEK